MRVVHVSKVKGIAGSEGHLLRLLPALKRRGIDVRMIVLVEHRRDDGGFRSALDARGIASDVVPMWGHVDPFVVPALARRFRDLAPDIVHTHLVHADLYGLRAASQARVPATVSSSHNIDAFRHRPAFRFLSARAMTRPDAIVAISDAVADFVREVEGAPRDRVVTIHYGLEPDLLPRVPIADARFRLGAPNGEPLIGLVGRLVPQKGVDVMLEALPHVADRVAGARLCVIGDGSLRATLEQQAARLRISDKVTFVGWVEHASALMPACDVIVIPSRYEGFGLVALEAMAASRPIVATRVDALREVVADGVTGRLVPADDPCALAEAIVAILEAPGRAAEMGRAGYRRLVEHFSVDRMVDATLAVYARVLGR